MLNKSLYIILFVTIVFSAQSAETWLGYNAMSSGVYLYDIKEKNKPIFIGEGLSGSADFNESSKVICGSYAGGSSKIWMADLSKGILKNIYTSNPDIAYSVNNGIISTRNGSCVYKNLNYGVSISSLQGDTREINLDVKKDSEGNSRVNGVFYNDHLDETILISSDGFYHLPKDNTSTIINMIKPFGVVNGYHVESLGQHAILANNGIDLYISAFISKSEDDSQKALVKLNAKTGRFVSVIMPSDNKRVANQPQYNSGDFYISDDNKSIFCYMGRDKNLYLINLTDNSLKLISDEKGISYNERGGLLDSNILVSYGERFRVWKTDIKKLKSILLDKKVSVDGKDNDISLLSVSHGNGGRILWGN